MLCTLAFFVISIMVWLMRLRGSLCLQDLEAFTGWDKSSLTADFHWLNLVAASALAPLIKWPDAEERLSLKHQFPTTTALYGSCVGFVDATCLKVRRPKHQQRKYGLFSPFLSFAHAFRAGRFWRGDKRMHCYTAQAIVDINGVIRHLSIGYPGGITNDRGKLLCSYVTREKDRDREEQERERERESERDKERKNESCRL